MIMWVVKDKDITVDECKLSIKKPIRDIEGNVWYYEHSLLSDRDWMWIPNIFGLSWEDEPLEIDIVETKHFNFKLSDEAKKIIEKDTNKTIEEIVHTPLKDLKKK